MTKNDLLEGIKKCVADAPARHSEWQKNAIEMLQEAANMISSRTTTNEAGKKGGATVKARHGTEFYQQIGRKGGRATKERHGSEHFKTMGAKGGAVVAKRHGTEHYQHIGTLGAARVRELVDAGKKTAATKTTNGAAKKNK